METNLRMSDVEAGRAFAEYEERLALADDLFDSRPFRLSQGDRPPSVSMYDAVMIALDRLWKDRGRIIASKAAVQAAYWAALDTPEKIETFTGRANTSGDVRTRIAAMEKIITAAL